MKNAIADEIKSEIIRLWLLGLQRDRIAESLNVSGGTVSHVVSRWKDQIGVPTAESVRYFCILAKTQNVTPLQCAEGFRVLNELKNCDVLLDRITPFLVEFYNMCISSNQEPKKVFSVCNQILELEEPVPLAQLPEFISKLVEKKRSLECDIATIEQGKEELQQAYSQLFDQINATRSDLKKYKKTEEELKKYNISLQDPEKIVNILENVNRIGPNPNKIVKELAEIKNCRLEKSVLGKKVADLRSALKGAEQELQVVEQKLGSGKQLLVRYRDIEEIRIGYEELKALKNIVLGSAATNSLDPEIAFKRFADDVLTSYDVKLGLDKKIAEMDLKLSAAQQSLDSIRIEYSKHQNVCDSVGELFNHNLQAADIMEISGIIKASGTEYSRIKQDLKLCGNLQNAISLHTARKEKLESENSKLSAENRTLKSEKDKMSEDIGSLNEQYKAIRQYFDTRTCRKALEYGNRIKEIRNVYVVAKAQRTQSIKALEATERQQMSLLHKINVPFELSPIVDAARGWTVNGEALKKATIKAMELMISRLDDNYNFQAKSEMKQALQSLKEEFMVF